MHHGTSFVIFAMVVRALPWIWLTLSAILLWRLNKAYPISAEEQLERMVNRLLLMLAIIVWIVLLMLARQITTD